MWNYINARLDSLYVADTTVMSQAQAAQEVLATLDLALQGPDDAHPPIVAAGDEPAALEGPSTASQGARVVPTEGTAAFGNIDNSYLPPVVWPATPHSNRAGQSYGNVSQSVATELQRMSGHGGRAGHAYGNGDMQQVEKQTGPRQLVKNIAAVGAVIIFGGLAIFPGGKTGRKHRS